MMADTELCALSASPGRCPWGHSLPLRLFLKAEGRAHPLELVVLGVVFPLDGSSFLAVHNALILLASMQTEYHVRSCHFICGATYVK
jgi:hypothetical protein